MPSDPGELTIPFVKVEISFCDDPLCRISLALFVAGCKRRCKGCQNPDLQNPAFGREMRIWEVESLVFPILEAGLVNSLVLLGGEWMPHSEQCYELVARLVLPAVLYTGERFEDLPDKVLDCMEWVIDGEWVESKRGIFPPSTNQRVFRKVKGEWLLVDPVELPLYQHLKRVREGSGGVSV